MRESIPINAAPCWWALFTVSALTWSCTAQITGESAGEPPDSDSTPASSSPDAVPGGQLPLDRESVARACKAKGGRLDAGRTPLRRLTRSELDNSVRVLLGVEAEAALNVTPDEKMGPFYSNAVAPVDELAVEQYQELATRVAAVAAPNAPALAGCDLAQAACAETFIQTFGRRAYRRPLEGTEATALLALFELGKTAGGATKAFQTVIEALLQSPFFLYHDDTYVRSPGGVRHPSAAPLALDDYALAARLSYFLQGTSPDDELMNLAGQGKLENAAELQAQAARLLASDPASEMLGQFHRQWLGVGDLPDVDRDASKFPAFGPDLVAAAFDETKLFASYVFRQGDGRLGTLLTSNLAFPRGPLFQVYAAAEPADFQPGTSVTLDPGQRAGLLTQSAFLMRHAHADQTSPVHRGILIRENLLCGKIIPPPPTVVVTLPPVDAATTTRQRFAQHVADPACGACHKDLDPLGLGFENYDAVGAYRTMDGLGAVDASGAFTNVRPDLEGPFVGAVQMAQALAQSSEVADCVSRQWFRFALGRVESFDDACTIEAVQSSFETSSKNVPELIAQLVTSTAFGQVRSTGGTQ